LACQRDQCGGCCASVCIIMGHSRPRRLCSRCREWAVGDFRPNEQRKIAHDRLAVPGISGSARRGDSDGGSLRHGAGEPHCRLTRRRAPGRGHALVTSVRPAPDLDSEETSKPGPHARGGGLRSLRLPDGRLSSLQLEHWQAPGRGRHLHWQVAHREFAIEQPRKAQVLLLSPSPHSVAADSRRQVCS
jgi:hypothetical protein